MKLRKIFKDLFDKPKCFWCDEPITIIQNGRGGPILKGYIKYCFHCGRRLRK
jgi:hypothetical protein